MIRQWEILHYPSEKDGNRYRLSLWADGPDVAKLRGVYADRVGSVWIPKRKPYNCAFFMYGITDPEKRELEDLLTGKAPFPELPKPSLPARQMRESLGDEDTQEILLREIHAREDRFSSSGIGGQSASRSVGVGYFVRDYLMPAAGQVHELLSRTLTEKKISVGFEKAFTLPYSGPNTKETQALFRECALRSVDCIVAVGESAHLENLVRLGRERKIFIKVVPEAMLDRNFWLTTIAEIVSFE